MLRSSALLLAGFFAVVAAVRFVYVASVCESGWDTVATQWQDSLAFVGLGHSPIGNRPPIEQAEYWLREIDNLLDRHPDSAETLMGAAWLLDSPDIGFLQSRLRRDPLAAVLPPGGWNLDRDKIVDELAAFEEKCFRRCLSLAEAATKREPNDERWWRLRALLQFDAGFLGEQGLAARGEDCLRVLEECERYDPDNALYDYLAARHLWDTSASYEWADPLPLEEGAQAWLDEEEEEGDWVLTIHDKRDFAEGVERFAEAQQKPLLVIGEAGYPAIAGFLEKSRLRKADQAAIAVSRLVTFRHEALLLQLSRWQDARGDAARHAGNGEEDATLLRQILRLHEQSIAPDETSAGNTLVKFGIVRQNAYRAIEELSRNHPDLIPADEFSQIRKREEMLRIEEATLRSALQSIDAEKNRRLARGRWQGGLSAVASSTVALLLIIAGVSLLVGRSFARLESDLPAFGPVRQAGVLVTVYAITFALFGLAPAEIIDRETQRSVALVSVWALVAAIGLGLTFFVTRLLRQRKIRFRLLTLLAAMTGAAVLASLWPLLGLSFEEIAAAPAELWMPERGGDALGSGQLRRALRLGPKSWEWAIVQWLAYDGWIYAATASLLVVTSWFSWRAARDARQGAPDPWSESARTRGALLLAFIGRSALGAGACWGVVYLAAAPGAIRVAESDFQSKIVYCRNPEAHLAEIRRVQATVFESAEEMAIIRDQVRYDLYGEGDGDDSEP